MHSPRVIQIVPIGPVARETLSAVAATTRGVFCAEAVVMPVLALPLTSYHAERMQFDADTLLDSLFDRLALDVSRIVGVTEVDLFAEGRNFVFGYAHMRDRVAIFSSRRLRDSFWGRPENLYAFRQRIDKALIHELGHTFHAPHCGEARCVMRQVEHLWQLDELAPELCASCEERISVVAARGVATPEGLFELAGSFMRRRRFARAVSAYGAACALDPGNPHYANDLGVALLAVGDKLAAARTFERAIELAPRCRTPTTTSASSTGRRAICAPPIAASPKRCCATPTSARRTAIWASCTRTTSRIRRAPASTSSATSRSVVARTPRSAAGSSRSRPISTRAACRSWPVPRGG
jgi:archaemetzincin